MKKFGLTTHVTFSRFYDDPWYLDSKKCKPRDVNCLDMSSRIDRRYGVTTEWGLTAAVAVGADPKKRSTIW